MYYDLIDRSEVIHRTLSSHVIMALQFVKYFTNKVVLNIYKMLLESSFQSLCFYSIHC